MAKIAIIGATSFLGKTLIPTLREEHELIGLSRSSHALREDIGYLPYDYPQKPLPLEVLSTCDVIFYCAGAGIQPGHQDEVAQIYEMNALEPIRLFNQLRVREYKGKLVTFGSYFEIGIHAKEKRYTPLDLVHNSNNLPNDYCKAKALLTRFLGQQLDAEPNVSFAHQHFILTNIYGAKENENRLIPYIIKAAKAGEELTFTSGVQKRQYTAIDDIANYLSRHLNNDVSGIYNLTDAQVITVRELIEQVVESVEQRLGSKLRPVFGEVEKRDLAMPFLALDMEGNAALAPLNPQVSLKQGVEQYMKYYEVN